MYSVSMLTSVGGIEATNFQLLHHGCASRVEETSIM